SQSLTVCCRTPSSFASARWLSPSAPRSARTSEAVQRVFRLVMPLSYTISGTMQSKNRRVPCEWSATLGCMMRNRADIVVVGGGVVGASIAYHLAKAGATDTVVIDRGGFASGSTGRSAGGVRQQFSTELNCRMSMLSVQKLRAFSAETGGDASFVQTGYLFLLTTESDWALFQRNVTLQQNLGLDVAL